jgi:hypothetical protein
LRRRLVDHYVEDVPGLSGAGLYWLVLGALAVVTPVALSFAFPESALVIAILAVLGLPLLQFATSVLCAIVLALWQRPDQASQLGQVGKITLGTLIGSVLGLLAMAALGVAFSLLVH